MPDRTPSPTRFRNVSLLIAAGLALLFSGVVLFYLLRGRATPPPASPAAAIPPTEPLDPLSLPQTSGPARVQFVDRQDPSRIAGELLWERLDPLAQGRYAAESPRVWIYLRDGRSLFVRAGTGELKIPGRTEQPESGRFEGGVVARLFAARQAGQPAVDPERDAPLLLASAPSLTFDRMTGELATADRISISTPDVEFQGVGLRVVFDEIRERPTLIEIASRDFLHAQASRADSAVGAAPREATPPAVTPEGPPTAPAAPVAAAPAPPREDFYHADLPGGVQVTAQGRDIDAERLQVWTRLVGGRLPDSGLSTSAPRPRVPDSVPTEAPPEPVPVPPTVEDPAPAIEPIEPSPALGESVSSRIAALRALLPPGSPAPLTPLSDEDILLTGDGPLTVMALEARPAELDRDELMLTFSGEGSGVTLADWQSGAAATAAAVSYGSTTRLARLAGDDQEGARLFDSRGASISGPDVSIGLESGIAQILGPGRAADPDGREVVWTDQADFEFATDVQRGEVRLESLREARLSGDVLARDDRSSLSGDHLHATFSNPPAAEGRDGKGADPLLSRVVVEGSAVASTLSAAAAQASESGPVDPMQGRDWLKANRIDTSFAPRADVRRSDPSIVTATGSVSGQRIDAAPPTGPEGNQSGSASPAASPLISTIRAELLEARLALDERSRVVVVDVDLADRPAPESAHPAGPVTFERSDGIRAECDTLHADVPEKAVDLYAAGRAVVSRGADSVAGPHIHLDGSRNLLGVSGPGTLTHSPPASPAAEGMVTSAATGPVTVGWEESLEFDDRAGTAECVGAVEAISRPDGDTIQTLRAERVSLSFAPPESEGADAANETLESAIEGRRLLVATAFGAKADASAEEEVPEEEVAELAGKGRPASVEVRHYAHDSAAPGGRRLDRLLYLEGDRIDADNDNAELTVPSPGRAVALDHRSVPEELEDGASTSPRRAPPPPIADFSNQRGSSLFVWNESMHYEHAPGVMSLRGGVELAHKPLGEKGAFALTARELDAFLIRDCGAAEPATADLSGEQLARAIARGAVMVETPDGNMHLEADEIDYDAARQVLIASSSGAGRVTLLDKRTAAPFAARRLSWNLRTDEILILQPLGAIVAPRK